MAGVGYANLWVLLGLGLAGIIMATRKLTKAVKEDFGAFFSKFQLLPPPQPAPPKAPHPLTAVSDIFDIEGHVIGFGNPDWERTHAAASRTSPLVSTLVEGGATCVGKTVIDEPSFSITRENRHYGTPTNPAVPPRVPGGSSSGSAVAIAAKLVDFSLGTDSNRGTQAPENVGEDRTVPATQSSDKKKRRWRLGTGAFREIRHFQKSTKLMIPAAPFIRTVSEISHQYSPEVSKWTLEALVALQEASEDFLVHLFEDGMLCAIHTRRVKKDFELARRLKGIGVSW